MKMKLSQLITCLLLLSCYQLAFLFVSCSANYQINNLQKLINHRKSGINPNQGKSWNDLDAARDYSPVYVGSQDGLMEADKIEALPGQPAGEVSFNQYAGYVTVDPTAGRSYFYYFVESPQNSSTNPLVLSLHGGGGCSPFGSGALEQLGPYRVSSDKKTLVQNFNAWNNVANVLFLESPLGTGFSYSNTSSDYETVGDTSTAQDSYIFLVNWLERFPQYKSRDLFITGDSNAGHYGPQLASTILSNNNITNQTVINLKGVAIGNPYIDDSTAILAIYDNLWTHAFNSDEANEGIHKYCNLTDLGNSPSKECRQYVYQATMEVGENIDLSNIYAPICNTSQDSEPKSASTSSLGDFDPCSDNYVESYLNLAEVQAALHAKPTNWTSCSDTDWTDSPTTMLPTIKKLTQSGIRLWIYSGDTDGYLSVTSSRYAIKILNLPIQTAWRAWYSDKEVGGYVVEYEGLTFATVRGAGLMVPSYQPERALTLISSFLQGQLPPPSS